VQPEEHNPITTTVGNSIAFAVFLWAAFGVYTALFCRTTNHVAGAAQRAFWPVLAVLRSPRIADPSQDGTKLLPRHPRVESRMVATTPGDSESDHPTVWIPSHCVGLVPLVAPTPALQHRRRRCHWTDYPCCYHYCARSVQLRAGELYVTALPRAARGVFS
jgi:hypothetical protein